jgi:acetoin utilization protein AcuC
MTERVLLICGEEIANYGFPDGHPFGPDRHDAFMAEVEQSAKIGSVDRRASRLASSDEIEYFHTPDYVAYVKELSEQGWGSLDRGDTPAYPGVYAAAAHVVGGTLDALAAIMSGDYRKAFSPIGGLHHAARGNAAGFCVFNDAGVAIEAAFRDYGLSRVAYVDIDAHHGDGVFYGFEDDPRALFADIHEDGRYLYPGTGSRDETGRGAAAGTKLNIPVPPGADDALFYEVWEEVEAYLAEHEPELLLLNCGADSLDGDPITHMRYSEDAHGHAAVRVAALSEQYCGGRVLAWGCGGYNRRNLARAWTRVVEGLVGD